MLALPDRGEAADDQLIIVDPAKISAEGQAKAVLCSIECTTNLRLADICSDIIPQHDIF